jgi:hypothetical protein
MEAEKIFKAYEEGLIRRRSAPSTLADYRSTTDDPL